MKLLIFTQKVDVNDDILGFFHQWAGEFAKKCEKVTVVCLEEGEYDLPENVKVLSLGKEIQNAKIKNQNDNSKFKIFARIKYLANFYKYIWEFRNDYDTVFVHMNPEYVVLGGLAWKLMKKKIYLWYTHKSVNLWLRIATNFADKIFTASDKSFRLESDKVVVTGHGIDVSKFKMQNANLKMKSKNAKFKVLTAGRISKSKNVGKLVEVAEILKDKKFSFEIKIAGGPVTREDKIYFEKLKDIVKEKKLTDFVSFVGAIPHKDVAEFYRGGDLFVNLSNTGSLDKAVLEAMASGLMVITSNEAFKDILPGKYFVNNNPEDIVEKIILLSKEKPDPKLREYVAKNHNLTNLIERITKEIS